jgi:hypothetical protein
MKEKTREEEEGMSLLGNRFSNKNKQIVGVSYNFVRGFCVVLGFCFSPNPIIEGNGKDRVEMGKKVRGYCFVFLSFRSHVVVLWLSIMDQNVTRRVYRLPYAGFAPLIN